MRTPIPRLKDRLGARHAPSSTIYATSAATVAVPNTQTIVLLNWLSFYNMNFSSYAGLYLVRTVPSTYQLALTGASGTQLLANTYAGAWQSVTSAPLSCPNDIMCAVILDRDNNNLQLWIDGILHVSSAITQDPLIDASGIINLNRAAPSTFDGTVWRASVMSLTAGQTPTEAQWSSILKSMRNPDAPIDPLLLSKVGALYSDFRPGEGQYDSATIADNGTSGNTLTWQDGTKVETVRTRQRVPWRKPKKTWYALKESYIATSTTTNFGFAVQPIIYRCLFRGTTYIGSALNALQNTANTHAYFLYQQGSSPWFRMGVKVGGVNNWIAFINTSEQTSDGDLWIVSNGTDHKLYLDGQYLGGTTTTAALDLTGDCQISFSGLAGRTCRLTVWNPATVPATLIQEIQDCVCNPEKDPPSLTDKLVDFALNSDTLPLTTSTTVANQAPSGLGTLTLSAARSTSCTNFLIAPSAT